MSRQALLRYRADRLLRNDFAGMRKNVVAAVAARLRARGVRLDAADLDACYAQAWHSLYAKMLRGEQIEDVAAWLVIATYRRAIDEHRARYRQQVVSDAQLALGWQQAERTDADVIGVLDDSAKLRQLLEGLKGSLSPREQQAAVLCYLHGLTRAQAARELGVSEKRMRKLMDGSSEKPGVASKVDAVLQAIAADEWCEQQDSLVRAYAVGMLDREGERYALAEAHVRECPRCRRLVLFLRGLATVLPPLPLPLRAQVGVRRHAASKSRVAARAHLLRLRFPALGLRFAAWAVMALGVGGGYALLGKGSPVGPARSAASGYRRLPAHAALAHAAPHAPAHAAARHTVPTHASVRHRRRAAYHRRRPVAVAVVPIAALPGPARSAPPKARAPLGEFTPERTR